MAIQFVAVTETGNQTGKVWYNDHTNQVSKLVKAINVAEIMGISYDELREYNNLADLNLDTLAHGNYSFSFEKEY